MSRRATTDSQLARACRGIRWFRGVYMRDELPAKVWDNESAIVNLNTSREKGSHWVCYEKRGQRARYFDGFGNLPPIPEILRYLRGCEVVYNRLRHQNFDERICGQLYVRFLSGQLRRNHTRRIK